MKNSINWKLRTAQEIASLIKCHYPTMSKKALREVVESFIAVTNIEAAGRELRCSTMTYERQIDSLKERVRELEEKLKLSNASFATYLKAEQKRMKLRILEAIEGD